jgi:hypothetical protein
MQTFHERKKSFGDQSIEQTDGIFDKTFSSDAAAE